MRCKISIVNVGQNDKLFKKEITDKKNYFKYVTTVSVCEIRGNCQLYSI